MDVSRQSIETLRTTTAAVLVSETPGGIRYDQQREEVTILVCGNECVDRAEVVAELRAGDVSVRLMGCLALCKKYEPLSAGTYGLLPGTDETPATPIIINK